MTVSPVGLPSFTVMSTYTVIDSLPKPVPPTISLDKIPYHEPFRGRLAKWGTGDGTLYLFIKHYTHLVCMRPFAIYPIQKPGLSTEVCPTELISFYQPVNIEVRTSEV